MILMDEDRTTRPYPLVAVEELEQDYNPESLRYAITQCRNVIARVIADDDHSNQHIARVRILRYLDFQLSRGAKWADDDTDLMAFVMRNVLELLAWANFVSASDENAATFLQETDVDSKELLTRFVKISEPDIVPDDLLKAVEAITSKRVSLRRADDHEEFIWKFCSKLIHPTALMLGTTPEDIIKSRELHRFFGVAFIMYAWRIIFVFHFVKFTI